MADVEKNCRHCSETIKAEAKVCPHCNRSQGCISSFLEPSASFTSLVSIILVILSCVQLYEARQQRISAESALKLATEAQGKADDAMIATQKAYTKAIAAKGEAEYARDEAHEAIEHLRTVVKLILEKEELSPAILREEADPIRTQKAIQKLQEFAVPDDEERKKWLNSLRIMR